MSLSMFNDLRAPETLKRLRRKECRWPFPDREEATFKEVLAAVTGLEIDLTRCSDPLMRFPCTREFVSFRKTAAEMAASSIFVLEPDRIVYLSREDSNRFWKEWAENHAPPKK